MQIFCQLNFCSLSFLLLFAFLSFCRYLFSLFRQCIPFRFGCLCSILPLLCVPFAVVCRYVSTVTPFRVCVDGVSVCVRSAVCIISCSRSIYLFSVLFIVHDLTVAAAPLPITSCLLYCVLCCCYHFSFRLIHDKYIV